MKTSHRLKLVGLLSWCIAMIALSTPAQAQTEYDIWICGTQVTSENCGDLSVIEGVNGTVTYDPTTKTLTLQRATINIGEEGQAIYSEVNDLILKVIDTNNVTTVKASALFFTKPLTITGGGTLNAKSEDFCAIYAWGTDLTIDDCTVNASSAGYGITGDSGESEKLTIRNAAVTAEGEQEGAICNFYSLTLEGCTITQPAGAAFDATLNGVALNGELVKSGLTIAKGTSGILQPAISTTAPKGIYTLNGQKLHGPLRDQAKGLYIVSGKKVVNK